MWTAEDCEVGEDESCGMSRDGRGGKESGLRDMERAQSGSSMSGNVKGDPWNFGRGLGFGDLLDDAVQSSLFGQFKVIKRVFCEAFYFGRIIHTP